MSERAPHHSDGVLLSLRGIGKRFGHVVALDGVDFDLRAGEVHALLGENGAGKSTLGKIITGVHRADEGDVRVDGEVVALHSPHDALAHGITGLAQEIVLVPDLSVIENVFLGRQPTRAGVVSRRRLREQYEELESRTGFSLHVRPEAKVRTLSLAERQQVEILRALARNARVVVMDEPTAALGRADAEQVYGSVRHLRRVGTAVIYVSHFLQEALALADRVTVLRDGRLVKSVSAGDETVESIVESMTGRVFASAFPAKRALPAEAPVRLRVQGLQSAPLVQDVSFDVRAGEIVGLAGLIGAGRTETAQAIFGAARRDAGTITLDGRTISPRSPRDAIDAGIAYLPESRRDQGLVMGRSILENISLAHLADVGRAGVIARSREAERCGAILERVGVPGERLRSAVSTLSGGNQQKVLFARWLFGEPRVFIADEPTRGVDIGAKAAIYHLLHTFAAAGMAVMLISSDHEEVIGLAHRVLVVRQGRIVKELRDDDVTEDQILSAALTG